MIKILGFALVLSWTGLVFLVGYLIGDRQTHISSPPVLVQNICNQSPKTEYIYVPAPDSCQLDDESYENFEDDYEQEYPNDQQFEPMQENLTHSENIILLPPNIEVKPTTQLMLGYRKNGGIDARLNVPVSENFGVYVGVDAKNQYAVGASFNLF